VWWLIAKRALIQLAIGLAIGMPGAYGVGIVLKSLLVMTSSCLTPAPRTGELC
jgi:hypothetical protein